MDRDRVAEQIVEEIAGIELKRRYKLDALKGVRGRNSDNTRLAQQPQSSIAWMRISRNYTCGRL
jgi:hypothetical protein